MRWCPTNLVRLLFFAGIMLMAGGCEFDPHVHAHSSYQPPSVYKDGVLWIAEKQSGENDEWFWVPQQMDRVGTQKNWQAAESIDVLVNGKVWRVTKTNNGTIDYEGWLDPDVGPSSGTVAGWILLLIVAVLAVGFGLHSLAKLFEAREVAQSARQEAKELKELETERRRRIHQELAEIKVERERLDEREAGVDARQATAEDTERRLRQLAISKPKDFSRATPPSRRKQRDLGKTVRAEYPHSERPGRDIKVTYVLDPELTGAVVFQFELLVDQPYPPHLTVTRNGRIIQTFDSFNGEFKDFLELPGERYRYIFRLSEGKRKFPHPLIIDLPLPSPEAWTRRTIPPPRKKRLTRAERQQRKLAWIEAEKEKARTYETDPAKLKMIFARIDQEGVDRFGEAE